MIDLKWLQKEVHSITKFLGYKVNKKNTLKKLKEEYREFKKAKPVNPGLVLCAANIRCDQAFMHFFETRLKNTEADEIPDDIFVKLSYCQEMGYDIEDLLMVKKRYNSLKKIIPREENILRSYQE